MSRYYTGPVTDHFDGERFFDPLGVPPGRRGALFRWFIERRFKGTSSEMAGVGAVTVC